MTELLVVIGLVASVVGAIPAVTDKASPRRTRQIASAVAVIAVLLCVLANEVSWRIRVRGLEEAVCNAVDGDRVASFEQIVQSLYYPDASEVEVAIDRLVQSGRMHQRVLDVVSAKGVSYKVRVFYTVAYEMM